MAGTFTRVTVIFSPALCPSRTRTEPILARWGGLAAIGTEDVGVAAACPVVPVWLPFSADTIVTATMIPTTATVAPVMVRRTQCRFLRLPDREL